MQPTILANLKDPDVSIRRRALDLLFTMCDGGSAVEVVEELVSSTVVPGQRCGAPSSPVGLPVLSMCGVQAFASFNVGQQL